MQCKKAEGPRTYLLLKPRRGTHQRDGQRGKGLEEYRTVEEWRYHYPQNAFSSLLCVTRELRLGGRQIMKTSVLIVNRVLFFSADSIS